MKTIKPLLALFVIVFVLVGCAGPGLDVSGQITMTGILQKQVPITTTGYWQVRTADYWLQASPTSGFGNAFVTLTVDPTLLEPGEHTSTVRLEMPGQPPQAVSVRFAFPRLKGSVVMGPAPASDRTPLSIQSLSSDPGRLLVGLKGTDFSGLDAADPNNFRQLAVDVISGSTNIDLEATFEASKVAVVRVADMRAAAAALSAKPNVRYVSPDLPLELLAFDNYRSQQWSHDVMHVNEAWTLGPTGAGVDVAVIDAGFEPDHPDFGDGVGTSYDFVSDSSTMTPRPACPPHGEHVAGIIAAERDSSGIDGIAPDATLHLLNVGTSEAGSCPLYTVDIVAALNWVTNEGGSPRADIVNMSFGGGHTQALKEAVQAAYAAGITLVAASGNSGTDPVLFPAAYPEVIAVSATGRFDELASYSTIGPEVFLSAPGGNESDFVLSTVHEYVTGGVNYSHDWMQGTSMASPAVAAVAALLKSIDSSRTPVEIAGLLADSSIDLGAQGKDENFGYGRVDAQAAVLRAQSIGTEPAGYRLRINGAQSYQIPTAENFIAGYVGGSITVEVGSDEDWDGQLNETNEYYGSITENVEFNGPYFEVQIPVIKQ